MTLSLRELQDEWRKDADEATAAYPNSETIHDASIAIKQCADALTFYVQQQELYEQVVKALIECRWKLAANQPTNGPHPNDVKALDMAEEALAALGLDTDGSALSNGSSKQNEQRIIY